MQSNEITGSRKSSIMAILSNYKYKYDMSENSVEHTLYKKIIEFDDKDKSKTLVQNRKEALEWINSIQKTANEVEYRTNKLRLQSDNTEGTPLMEQGKIELLHKMGWYYNGNFHRNKNDDDKVGYPNLSFNVSTRKIEGGVNEDPIYMYMASYGIVNNEDSNTNGSYSLFLTLDECVKFIVNELEYTHKDILYGKEMSKLFKQEKAKDLQQRIKDTADEQERRESVKRMFQEFSNDPATRKAVRDTVERLAPNSAVEKEIYRLQRSSDVSALPDFINEFLIRMARNSWKSAVNHEQEAKKAGNIIRSYDSTKAEDGQQPHMRDSTPQIAKQQDSPVVVPPAPKVDDRRASQPRKDMNRNVPTDDYVAAAKGRDVSKTTIKHPNEIVPENGGVLSVNSPIKRSQDEKRNYQPVDAPEDLSHGDTSQDALHVDKNIVQSNREESNDILPDTPVKQEKVATHSDFPGVNVEAEHSHSFAHKFENIDMSSQHSQQIAHEFDEINIVAEPSLITQKEFDEIDIVAEPSLIQHDEFGGVDISPGEASKEVSTVLDNVVEEPRHSAEITNTADALDITFHNEKDKVFDDDDIINKIRESMPDLLDSSRTPKVDESQDGDEIDDIIGRF